MMTGNNSRGVARGLRECERTSLTKQRLPLRETIFFEETLYVGKSVIIIYIGIWLIDMTLKNSSVIWLILMTLNQSVSS